MSVGTPTVYNVTCTNADTEYTQDLSTSFSETFLVQARNADIFMYFIATATPTTPVTTYITIFQGASYFINIKNAGFMTLRFQTKTPGAIAEILEWK